MKILHRLNSRFGLLSSRTSGFLTLSIFILNALAASYLGISSYRNPLGNWDIVPYTALIRQGSDYDQAALSRQVYSEIRRYVGDKRFETIVGGEGEGDDGAYRKRMMEIPEALAANLQFYSIKPLYIFLSKQATALTNNAAAATVLISAIALSLFIVIFPLMFRWSTVAAIALWALLSTGEPKYLILGAAASPDSLGILLAVSTVLLAVIHRCSLWVVTPMALLAVLARPDIIFIITVLFCGLAWLERKDGRLLSLMLCFAGITAVFIYLNAQALPWSTLFRHTFFGRQIYPSVIPQPVSIVNYLEVLERTLPQVVSWRTTLFLTFGSILALVPWLLSRTIGRQQLLAAIAVINMVAHYLIFPTDEYGHERMFLSSYILIIASVLLMLQSKIAISGHLSHISLVINDPTRSPKGESGQRKLGSKLHRRR